jgi:hypothetical protein
MSAALNTVWFGGMHEGESKYHEDVVYALEYGPEAFIGMLTPQKSGKLIVKVADRSRSGNSNRWPEGQACKWNKP